MKILFLQENIFNKTCLDSFDKHISGKKDIFILKFIQILLNWLLPGQLQSGNVKAHLKFVCAEFQPFWKIYIINKCSRRPIQNDKMVKYVCLVRMLYKNALEECSIRMIYKNALEECSIRMLYKNALDECSRRMLNKNAL
jgi:hypothetical protein